jgi:sulfur-oxidizing protein SoxZ
MTEPTRIRAQVQANGSALVRVLMTHDMESGQRKDDAGKPIPAWHITEVNVALNGQPVLRMHAGTGVSKNPFLQFTLKAAKAGDKIAIGWVDNKGQRRQDEAVIA